MRVSSFCAVFIRTLSAILLKGYVMLTKKHKHRPFRCVPQQQNQQTPFFLQLSFPLGQEVPGNQLDLFLPFFFSLHTRSFFFSEFNDTRIMSQNGRRKSYEQQADYEVKSFSDSAATTSSDYGRPPRYDKTANDNKV